MLMGQRTSDLQHSTRNNTTPLKAQVGKRWTAVRTDLRDISALLKPGLKKRMGSQAG